MCSPCPASVPASRGIGSISNFRNAAIRCQTSPKGRRSRLTCSTRWQSRPRGPNTLPLSRTTTQRPMEETTHDDVESADDDKDFYDAGPSTSITSPVSDDSENATKANFKCTSHMFGQTRGNVKSASRGSPFPVLRSQTRVSLQPNLPHSQFSSQRHVDTRMYA
ncbi:Hypothetical predicted protein [Cloeon dipterum]|uniref:Uncharacterized protein n=1 Tax=Cloeon dipterum TaxID=197152 RepID=A0A8S1C125_9INSE|nr:Hypothetical predicted protein [Cloeon dipterum]